jgi:hypothetical protein
LNPILSPQIATDDQPRQHSSAVSHNPHVTSFGEDVEIACGDGTKNHVDAAAHKRW